MFETLLYQPIYNLIISLYNLVPDMGVAILLITILIKVVLYPLTTKSIKAQKSLTELQPKMEEVKKKHKDNQQQLAQETMKLYKEHKVNPFGSCLPVLVQLPIFIALYWVLRDIFVLDKSGLLYTFVSQPESINPITLGFFNLSDTSFVLAILAGAAQFWQAKMFSKKRAPKAAKEGGKDENMMSTMYKQMLYFMPAFTVIIGMGLPAGLTLYWFLSTLSTAVQQDIIFRKKDNEKVKMNNGVIEGEAIDKK